MEPTSAMLEQVGRELHAHYVAHRLEDGENRLRNPVLMPWSELPPHLRHSNRETARQIWRRLEAFGYDIVPTSDLGVRVRPKELHGHMEVLAQMGHSRWVNQRLSQGWTYAPGVKNIELKTSPCLVDWSNLPRHEQDKEREQIEDLHDIVERCGLKIIRSRHLAPRVEDLPEDEASQPEPIPVAPDPWPPAELILTLARLLHGQYVRRAIERGQSVQNNPSLRPWERLAPSLQYSSRNTAAQVWRRFESIGYDVVPIRQSGVEITPAEYARHHEALAELGHVCWMNERLSAGWVFGEGPKSLEKKTHPWLVPWNDLPEIARENERQLLRDLPAILQDAGLHIVRGHVSAFEADPDFTPIPRDNP